MLRTILREEVYIDGCPYVDPKQVYIYCTMFVLGSYTKVLIAAVYSDWPSMGLSILA